ncbi:MAG: hypothetical protein WDO69_15815 [Pseudomonadota bacterium]
MNCSRIAALTFALSFPLVAGCNTSEPTSAVLSNEYPPASSVGSSDAMPVYKGWWTVAQFPDPVLAGQVSDPVRVVQGSDYGYALLAPAWDPASGTPPTTLIPLRSAQKLTVARGEVLSFIVSDQTTLGDCRAGRALTQEDADYVTKRIFPTEFANLIYDAESCTTSPVSAGEGGAGGAGGDGQ